MSKVIVFICFSLVLIAHLYVFGFFNTTYKTIDESKIVKTNKVSSSPVPESKKLKLSDLASRSSEVARSKSIDTNHSYTYCLPFMPGNAYLVSQTQGRTHKGKNKNAIDFVIPKGAGVFVARPGFVVNLANSFSESGGTAEYLNKANYVYIRHKDGSHGMYAHLDYDGVKVKVGDYVRLGQQIGYSGNTGFSNGAHLHFEVLDSRSKSIPLAFWTKSSIREQLKPREKYYASRDCLNR